MSQLEKKYRSFDLVHSYLGKRNICTVCSRPPLLELNLSRQSFRRSSLVCNPVYGRKWIGIFFLSPSLHNANCEVLGVDILGPRTNGVMDCYGVVQLHVVDSDLDMNHFIWIEAIWRENDCLTTRIGPFWNMEKFYSATHNWKTCVKHAMDISNVFKSYVWK